VIVRFVEIGGNGGIVDHHCLKFLFIKGILSDCWLLNVQRHAY